MQSTTATSQQQDDIRKVREHIPKTLNKRQNQKQYGRNVGIIRPEIFLNYAKDFNGKKMDNMQEQMDNVSKEMEILRKNQEEKKCRQWKNCSRNEECYERAH